MEGTRGAGHVWGRGARSCLLPAGASSPQPRILQHSSSLKPGLSLHRHDWFTHCSLVSELNLYPLSPPQRRGWGWGPLKDPTL